MDSSGSRNDLLLRLSNELQSRHTYDKVFQKNWAASGKQNFTVYCMCKILLLLRFFTGWNNFKWCYSFNIRKVFSHTHISEDEKLFSWINKGCLFTICSFLLLSISGSWAVIMCPCGIVYSIKCNIRAESPRDFTDMLLSWKYMPNIVI